VREACFHYQSVSMSALAITLQLRLELLVEILVSELGNVKFVAIESEVSSMDQGSR
jgi:hypothetical protein